MAGFPEPGAFIHVLIKPFLSCGQVKFLDQNGQLGIGKLERGEYLLEELEGHEVVGEERLV